MKKVLFSLLLIAFLMPFASKAQTKAANHDVQHVKVCDSYEWINGVTYTEDTAVVFLRNDTLYVLDLTVNHSSVSTVSEPIQAGCSYRWGDTLRTVSGTYTHKFTDRNRCDSTVTITLNIIDTAKVVVDTVVCSSIKWRGETLNTNGTYYDTVSATSAATCDSTFKLILAIDVPDTVERDTAVTGCNSVTFGSGARRIKFDCNDSVYSADPYVLDTALNIIITANGACRDSVVNVSLIVNMSQYVPVDTASCGPFVWGNYSSNESVVDTLKVGRDVHGCDSMMVLKLTVKNDLTLSIAGNLDLKTGESTTLSAVCDQPANFVWHFNGSTSNDSTITLTNVVENTDVELTASTTEGCSRTTSVTVMASPYVGIAEIENNIRIYPNPTAAMLNIESANGMEEVVIYNALGQRVYNASQLASKATIDLSNYSNGVYTVSMRMQDGSQVSKNIVVKK